MILSLTGLKALKGMHQMKEDYSEMTRMKKYKFS
jgi:hypothetical protein